MKNDYDHPGPMPDDLFRVYDLDGDHGYFMAGTKGTGKTYLGLFMSRLKKESLNFILVKSDFFFQFSSRF